MQANKSICLKGNIQNGPLCYRPYPVNEFSTGCWSLAVSSISYDSSVVLSNTCAITSNFSASQKRTSKGEIKVYEMPLAVFHLKTTSTTPRSVFRFSPVYYPMNSIGDELRVSLVDIFQDNDVPLTLNCDVVVQILFQRN
jgi:hypothetical protein